MKLERKFGQPQIIIRAYVDNFYNSLPVKMHSSDSIISFTSMIANIVGVFKSLHNNADLESATLLHKAVEKLPPNMKESWSFHTVKWSLYAPSLIDFNHWLEDKKLKRMNVCVLNQITIEIRIIRFGQKPMLKCLPQTRKLSLTQIFNIVHV